MKKITFIILLLAISSPAFAAWNPMNFEVKPVIIDEGNQVKETNYYHKGVDVADFLRFTFDAVSGDQEQIQWKIDDVPLGKTFAAEPAGTFTNELDLHNLSCGWKTIIAEFGGAFSEAKVAVLEVQLFATPNATVWANINSPSTCPNTNIEITATYCPDDVPGVGEELRQWTFVNNNTGAYIIRNDEPTDNVFAYWDSADVYSELPGSVKVIFIDTGSKAQATIDVDFKGVTDATITERTSQFTKLPNTMTLTPSIDSTRMTKCGLSGGTGTHTFVEGNSLPNDDNTKTDVLVAWSNITKNLLNNGADIQVDGSVTIRLGNDFNSDGILEVCEVQITAVVIENGPIMGKIESARKTTPTENPFELKEGEHQEVGAKFKFNLPGHGGNIKWQIYDESGLGGKPLIHPEGKGVGTEGAITWGVGEIGLKSIKFYVDCNDDNFWTSDEQAIQSPKFWVMNKRVITMEVEYSSRLPVGFDATIEPYFTRATEIVLRRDSVNDYRACVIFVPSTKTEVIVQNDFNLPNLFLDPANMAISVDRDGNYVKYFESTAHLAKGKVIFIHSMYDAAGVGSPSSFGMVVGMNWNNDVGETIAHEFGHNVGLALNVEHVGYDEVHVMHKGSYGGIELKKTDAKAYDKGN